MKRRVAKTGSFAIDMKLQSKCGTSCLWRRESVAFLLVSLKFPDALLKHFSLAQLAQSAACDTTALPRSPLRFLTILFTFFSLNCNFAAAAYISRTLNSSHLIPQGRRLPEQLLVFASRIEKRKGRPIERFRKASREGFPSRPSRP